jgi:hypothetical protein
MVFIEDRTNDMIIVPELPAQFKSGMWNGGIASNIGLANR